MEKEITKVKKTANMYYCITDKTTGHGTHSNPKIWGEYLKELLLDSEPTN
jgi:homoserine O-acetyltransferase